MAAVSNAGGLGVLGAARFSPDQLRAAIRDIRAATSRPFGVNLLLAPPVGSNRDVAAAQKWLVQARDNGVPEAALAMGDMAARTPASRDKAANDLLHLLSLGDPRTDAPATLPPPAPNPHPLPCGGRYSRFVRSLTPFTYAAGSDFGSGSPA